MLKGARPCEKLGDKHAVWWIPGQQRKGDRTETITDLQLLARGTNTLSPIMVLAQWEPAEIVG